MGIIPGIGLVGSVGQSKACRMIFANFDNMNRLVKSTDLGLTFSVISAVPQAVFIIVAISDDGKYVMASIANPGYGYGVYISNDSGTTWTKPITFTSADIPYHAMDGTGQYQTVFVINGSTYNFYRSTNWGSSFSIITSSYSGYGDVNNGCMSLGGQYQYFNFRTKIRRSINYGASWSDVSIPSSRRLQCDSSGAKLVCDIGADILYSNDYGVTWNTYYTGLPTSTCRVGISGDGFTIVAIAYDEGSGLSSVVVSIDGGASYTTRPQTTGAYPVSVNVSKDGKVILFNDNYTVGLRKSIDYGVSWSIIYVAGNGSNSVMNAGV